MTYLLVLGVVMCGDWWGWRGLEAQGAADCNCPLTWDANSVVWHTPIAGKGHSSPVVAGDRIFVTTAETSMRGQLFRPRALQGLAAAVLFLGGVAVMLARKQSIATAAAAATVYGVLAGGLLVTSAFAKGDSPALRYFAWMHGGTALAVGVAAGAIFMRRRASRIGTAVALLVLTGGLWTLRPDPGYYTLSKWDYWTWVTVWPMVVGLLGTVGVVITSQAKSRTAQSVRPAHAWRLVAAMLAATSSYVLISLLARRLPVPHTHVLYINSLIFAPYVIGMLLWCGIGFRLRPLPCAPLAVGSVLIGALGFACVNLGWRPECLRSVVSVDLPTGRTLWKTPVSRGPLIPVNEENSAATPTPVIHQGRV